MRSLIDAAVIVDRIESSEKADALRVIIDAVVEAGRLTRALGDVALVRMRSREQLGSTGIGNGVAVPHVKLDDGDEILIALARSPDGLEWQAVDGRPVQLVFMIIGSTRAAERHLALLRWISTVARNADFRRFVKSSETATELRTLLHEMAEE